MLIQGHTKYTAREAPKKNSVYLVDFDMNMTMIKLEF